MLINSLIQQSRFFIGLRNGLASAFTAIYYYNYGSAYS